MTKARGLGKGLESLLPSMDFGGPGAGDFFLCPVEAIDPNPYQPRRRFEEEPLAELAASIREKGVIQPLVVRRLEGGRYEIIAGERRWRASQLAGLEAVPVAVKDVSSAEVLELALIENIQRQDLNPLEEADAYDRLIREFELTQAEVAKRVGKERTTVTNMLRLLQLPDYAREDVTNGVLSMGHARTLLSLQDDPAGQRRLRDAIVVRGLSVRQAEAQAAALREGDDETVQRARKKPGRLPRQLCRDLTRSLTSVLGSRTRIVQNGGEGKLEISYSSAEDLNRLVALIVDR